jgi:hypothetical protein
VAFGFGRCHRPASVRHFPILPLEFNMLRKIFAKVAAVAVCGVIAAAGCGPSGPQYAEISGKVTVKGSPVTAGEVYFKLVDAEYSGSALIKADATYNSKSIPVGKCKVMVRTKTYNPNPTKGGASSGGGGSRPPSGPPSGGGGPPPGYGSGPGGGGGGRPAPNTARPDWISKTNPNDPGPGKYVPTPEKYENESTTTLEFEVKSGQNSFDIDLKD